MELDIKIAEIEELRTRLNFLVRENERLNSYVNAQNLFKNSEGQYFYQRHDYFQDAADEMIERHQEEIDQLKQKHADEIKDVKSSRDKDRKNLIQKHEELIAEKNQEIDNLESDLEELENELDDHKVSNNQLRQEKYDLQREVDQHFRIEQQEDLQQQYDSGESQSYYSESQSDEELE